MDLIGKKFGKWIVCSFVGRDAKSNKIFECICECGDKKKQRIDAITNGESTQCKKCRMSELNKVEELIGKKFGSWTVVSKEKNKQRNEWYYYCICKCGTDRNIAGSNLKSGQTTQCHKCRCKTHGMSYTNTFKIWTGILRRCLNPNFKAYKYYGGRGIKVCERWLKFENFLADMGERPGTLQIDRINNDGDYEPSNCRWVTAAVNNANRNIIKEKKTSKAYPQ